LGRTDASKVAGVHSDRRHNWDKGDAMHARLVTITGADVDSAVRYLEETAAPVIAEQRGFRQVAASGDRARGIVSIVSVWESLADLEASDSAIAKIREEGVRQFGGEATVKVFEQVAQGVNSPPQPGSVVRIQTTKVDPGRIDETVEWFTSAVLPAMMQTPGVSMARNLIDRATGEGRVAVVYSDRAALEASDSARKERMAAAGQRGVEFGEALILDVLYSKLP
jgi:heme-degrading monooxygenase HmoA